jgi:hypothetical protein
MGAAPPTPPALDGAPAPWNDLPTAMSSRFLRSTLIAVLFGAALGAGGLAAMADPPKGGFAPDPLPGASRTHWVFDVGVVGGKISLERVKAVTYDKPVETPRVMGRFALELYIGRELLDRVRFNVPLMGGESSETNRNGLPKPRFEQNVTARVTARIADNPRAAYLLLVDRETGDTQKLAWPPERDGRLVLWTSGISDGGPGDFPDGGVHAAGLRDGGDPADSGRD